MKLFKFLLFIFAVVLSFISCETTKMKNMHKRMLRTELSKYSDFLDLARTEIYLEGRGYYWHGSPGNIYLSLYLKPNHNNRETIFAIRDELIDFFNANWETREVNRVFPYRVAVNFTLGETETFYIMSLVSKINDLLPYKLQIIMH